MWLVVLDIDRFSNISVKRNYYSHNHMAQLTKLNAAEKAVTTSHCKLQRSWEKHYGRFAMTRVGLVASLTRIWQYSLNLATWYYRIVRTNLPVFPNLGIGSGGGAFG